MMLNKIELLEKLDKMEDHEVTYLYQKVFHGSDAEFILIDLMDKFFEFRPTSNDHQAGSQAVIIYIKNRLLGIAEQQHNQPGEN